jgi:hypothetical protein
LTPAIAPILYGFSTFYAQSVQEGRSLPYLSALMVQAVDRLACAGMTRADAVREVEQTVVAVMDDVDSYAL